MKSTFSWINPDLGVRHKEKKERGVFAKKFVKKGELLSIFGGYIIGIADEKKLPCEFNDTGVQIHDNFVLGIRKKSELEAADYINHSCDPNAGFKGQIFLVAIRDIKKGEEIAFDYAMAVSVSRKVRRYNLRCDCGAKNCRGIITNDDWKIPELQKKYDGFFQLYLQEKIKKIKTNGI
jgi:SET domain-containing protein